MNFIQILDGGTAVCCPHDLYDVISIVKFVITILCWAIPIILIILTILDISKIVTAGNIDDKLKKEVTGKITTRLIFAVLIFLVPTIVGIIFNFIPVVKTGSISADGKKISSDGTGATWSTCWYANDSDVCQATHN